jgi:pimeloyl-ACP methyl ester carboxylesterase
MDDVLSGVDHLCESGRVRCGDNVGIFGGSYGGYLTLRALATSKRMRCGSLAHSLTQTTHPLTTHAAASPRLRCGVAQYGFVMQRWMSLETGDFTFEDEYFGQRNRWPVPVETTGGDIFDRLHCISAPCLLLHGADDDICPLSQVPINPLINLPACLPACPPAGRPTNRPTDRPTDPTTASTTTSAPAVAVESGLQITHSITIFCLYQPTYLPSYLPAVRCRSRK